MVSIIIPMYNRADTIVMAIDSVLQQTYEEFEVIVVDDCSTDNSVEIVKNMDDSRIRVIQCDKNGGACKARNIGIEAAKGEIIAFHDSDDFWHRDKLEKSLYYLDKEKADFVFSALNRINTNEKKKKNQKVPFYNLNKEDNKLSKILSANCVSTQTIVAKREVFDKIRFDARFPRFQDWDLAVQVIRSGYHVYFIEESLVDCYVMSDSITADGRKVAKAYRLFEKKYEKEFKKNPAARYVYCYRAGCLLERSGFSGTVHFLEAYRIKKSAAMLIRYILARMNLYKKACSVINIFVK